MKDIEEIIKGFIFDFYQNKTVKKIINTVYEAIEIEKHLKEILTRTLIKVEKTNLNYYELIMYSQRLLIEKVNEEINRSIILNGKTKINEKKTRPKDF